MSLAKTGALEKGIRRREVRLGPKRIATTEPSLRFVSKYRLFGYPVRKEMKFRESQPNSRLLDQSVPIDYTVE
jgi:hypothetical protein